MEETITVKYKRRKISVEWVVAVKGPNGELHEINDSFKQAYSIRRRVNLELANDDLKRLKMYMAHKSQYTLLKITKYRVRRVFRKIKG